MRWLNDEPDPHDLMRPFPAEPMRMWLISTRVNKPENDEPLILEPLAARAIRLNQTGVGWLQHN
jgi:putative SOS response-associated peptidase YedK